MPVKYTYLLVDIFCLLFPLIASFHPRIQFYKQWRYFILPCIITAILFLIWDIFFVIIGVWEFNEKFITGIYMYNMPIEEVLFFICIPYACTFTYYCINKFIAFKLPANSIYFFNYLFIILLAVATFVWRHKLYTSVTFFFLALFLFIAMQRKFAQWAQFYIAYSLILIPFLVTNGILTGSFISSPVVLYNDLENLDIRIFTIPIEDVFYALLLMGMNVYGFEQNRNKKLIMK